MNIIFINYLVPLEDMNMYKGISVAGNKMQYNIVKELGRLNNANVKVISLLPYACYPQDNKVFVRSKRDSYREFEYQTVSYLNLPIIKQFTQIFFLYLALMKNLRSLDNNTVVLGFNMFPQIGIPLRKIIKKKYKGICLLADLPIDDATDRKGISRILRNFFDKSTIKSISECNNFIVLSKFVSNDYLKTKSTLLIEGGVDENDISKEAVNKIENEKKVLVFSGALTEYNGITTLIESLQFLKNINIELHIYGNGNLKKYVEESQKKDDRIKYFGKVSNDEIKKIQRRADILVNPRQTNNPISKYTFPSKIFEYFLSRTLVVSTKIPSYPPEYLDKMILAEDSALGLANALKRAINLTSDEKSRITNIAFDFIINEKKWSNQAKKIYKFMENIINE